MNNVVCELVVIIIGVFVCVSESGRLNDYILDYQPLTYDRSAVHRNHQRVRRAIDSHFYLRFTAYGKQFHVKLVPSEGLFSPHHQAYIDGKGLHQPDTSFIYSGSVDGDANSQVHLAVHRGSVEGEVHTGGVTYHIEPASKYITRPLFHTIIYPETHLDTDPYRARREAEAGSCGLEHGHVHSFMEEASRLEEEPTVARTKRASWRDVKHTAQDMYSEHINRQKRSDSEPKPRQKRALGSKTACPLHIRADPLLFAYFKYTKHGKKNVTDPQAEEEILAFFANHVNAMSNIYKNTVFQTYSGGTKNTGLTFVIHRSTVMKNCDDVSRDYCRNSVDVSNYLDLTSKENHDTYCLTFTFTYRDFSGGTLGLAWVATESNVNSGVCGRHRKFTGGFKSLNTGIVTIINFGRTVPNRVSQLTFSHEAGHNFGSPHDEGSSECAPFGTNQPDAAGGNFIMFPSATSGNRPNNARFSVCSRDNMTRIIQQVVDNVRFMCFVESGQAFCGNKITEEGEECDCGFGVCANNTCCQGKNEQKPNSGCRLTPEAICSPDSGPCCQDDCKLNSADSKVCRQASECMEEALCNGLNFTCPHQKHKANGTFCNDYTKVCVLGECIGSVCETVTGSTSGAKWEECFQTSDTGQESELCFLACKNPTTGECISSANTDALNKAHNSALKDILVKMAQLKAGRNDSGLPLDVMLAAGSACDNFRGYCDTFSTCQLIDSKGPFDQLTNLIFDPVNLRKVREWIVEYWWAVLLMCLGLVVFMGVFIKVFGYNTPSVDPKKKRLSERYTNPQRPPQQQQQQQPSAPPSARAPPRPSPRSGVCLATTRPARTLRKSSNNNNNRRSSSSHNYHYHHRSSRNDLNHHLSISSIDLNHHLSISSIDLNHHLSISSNDHHHHHNNNNTHSSSNDHHHHHYNNTHSSSSRLNNNHHNNNHSSSSNNPNDNNNKRNNRSSPGNEPNNKNNNENNNRSSPRNNPNNDDNKNNYNRLCQGTQQQSNFSPPSVSSSYASKPPSYVSGPPSYRSKDMDVEMAHYPRSNRGQQFDRLAPKYSNDRF
ncbi:hypothetical protein ACOMHN_020097 [Nucella lapillus]